MNNFFTPWTSVFPQFLGEGFGINTNLYETNVLNLAVVLFVVINFGGSVITDILSLRRTEILNALSTAEAKAQEAKEQIQKEETELKSIEEKAQTLLNNAKKNAERGRTLLLEQHKKDLSDTYDAFILRKFVEQREVTDGLRAIAQNFACLRATTRLEKSMAQKDHLLIMDKGLDLFSKNL
jgi:F-type H+-transporting ATPase subunit b